MDGRRVSHPTRANTMKMKLKTHRGAAKRFKKTGTGKFVRSKSFKRHILTSKSTKRKRGLRKDVVVSPSEQGKLERMLPYK
jgi:large subunit ribosomal protein L35